MDEHAATDRAVSFVRASGSRLYGAEEEVEADGFGLRPWGARREGRLWVVVFLPAEPPGVVSAAHSVFVYLDDASGEAEYLDGAVGRTRQAGAKRPSSGSQGGLGGRSCGEGVGAGILHVRPTDGMDPAC